MSDLIDITSSILSSNTITFDDRNISIVESNPNYKFGILNFTAVRLSEIFEEIELLFVIDCSGSMSDICCDGKSKMQHIIHTLKNMVIFFHERPNIKVNITINAFDSNIYNILTRTTVCHANLDEILKKIDKIYARGRTNISYALHTSYQTIKKLKEEFPNSIINHIFMTDGEATEGSSDVDELMQLIDRDSYNAFIGFGNDHDVKLLNGLCVNEKCGYYFIDKLENAGLVYGEILHSIVYKLLSNVTIEPCEGCLIYNYKTNTWDTSLAISDIASESNKTYNIACLEDIIEKCTLNIKGKIGKMNISFPARLTGKENLLVHVYRQLTLELLYKSNRITCYNYDAIKQELYELMEHIKISMKTNDSKLLKNLCDDVYVCYKTLGTRYGNLFCRARQTSQGNQRLYTATNLITKERTYSLDILPLKRQTNSISDIVLNDDIFNEHTMSGFDDSPYLTPQAEQLMRDISNK